jgi:hypothetical protein
VFVASEVGSQTYGTRAYGQLAYSFEYESKKGEGIVTRAVGGGKYIHSNVASLSENKSLCPSLDTSLLFLPRTVRI